MTRRIEPFDDETEADEEQGRGEDGEHGRVLRRAGVPGDPCRCERLLFEYLALGIELEWRQLAEQLLGGESLSRPQVLADRARLRRRARPPL